MIQENEIVMLFLGMGVFVFILTDFERLKLVPPCKDPSCVVQRTFHWVGFDRSGRVFPGGCFKPHRAYLLLIKRGITPCLVLEIVQQKKGRKQCLMSYPPWISQRACVQ